MMKGNLPSKIQISTVCQEMITENSLIIRDMIKLYNTDEFPAILKINCERSEEDYLKSSGTSSKYITYSNRKALYNAIVVNCPDGLKLSFD